MSAAVCMDISHSLINETKKKKSSIRKWVHWEFIIVGCSDKFFSTFQTKYESKVKKKENLIKL